MGLPGSRFWSTQACTGLKCAAENWKTSTSLKCVPLCVLYCSVTWAFLSYYTEPSNQTHSLFWNLVMCPMILFSTPSCSDNGRNRTSSNMLFALIVVVDQLVGGKEHCPASLTPPCRHCLEPPCASSHCLPSHRAAILRLPPRACSIPNPSTPSLYASPCHWLRSHALNTSLVFSDCCSQNSAGWRGWEGDKHQSSTSRQTQQSTHNK